MTRYLLEDEEDMTSRRRDARNYKSSREDVADVLKTFLFRIFFLILLLSGILLAFTFRNEIFNPAPDPTELVAKYEDDRVETDRLIKEQAARKETDTEQIQAMKLVQARQTDRDFPLTAYDRNLIRKYWLMITNGMPNEEISRLMEILDMRYNDEGEVVDLASREVAYLKTIRQTPAERNDREMLEKLRESVLTLVRDGEKKDRQIADMKQIIHYSDEKFQMLDLLRECLRDKSFFPTEEERVLMQKNWMMVTDWLDKMEAMSLMTRLYLCYDKEGNVMLIPKEMKEDYENQRAFDKKKAETGKENAGAGTENAGNAETGKSENPAASGSSAAEPPKSSGENGADSSSADADAAARNLPGEKNGAAKNPAALKPAETGDQMIYNLVYADREKNGNGNGNGNGKKTEKTPTTEEDAIYQELSAYISDQTRRMMGDDVPSADDSDKKPASKNENDDSQARDDSSYLDEVIFSAAGARIEEYQE